MSSFKEQARADILTTFMRTDEFADEHTIDDKPMHVIIDGNELLERSLAVGQVPHADGLYKARLLIYVPAAEYGPKPKIGKLLLLDGKRQFQIVECIDEDGIYSMELEAMRS